MQQSCVSEIRSLPSRVPALFDAPTAAPVPARTPPPYEVIVVGGSYAGLAAALTLGRSLHRVIVVVSGKPANRFAPAAHNVTHDGRPPGEIARLARQDLDAYPTVEFVAATAREASRRNGRFAVGLDTGVTLEADTLTFATGMRDVLPDLPGYRACWGRSVIHCPYCHGYEYAGRPTGILTNGEEALDFLRLVAHWTDDVTLLTDGPARFDVAEAEAAGAVVVESPLAALAHREGHLTHATFADREPLPLAALYHRPAAEQHCSLPAALGCDLTAAGHLAVDATQATSASGIYAAGDCTTPFRSVAVATAQGTVAGAMLNHALLAPLAYAHAGA